MRSRNLVESEALFELAAGLTAEERQLLENLFDRGPGLPFELAVRVLKFAEDIGEAVAALQAKALIRVEPLSGGQFGGELLSVSETGRQVVNLLRSEQFAQQMQMRSAAPVMQQSAMPAPPEDELSLVIKLASLAEQRGDAEEASRWYKEALTLKRSGAAAQTEAE